MKISILFSTLVIIVLFIGINSCKKDKDEVSMSSPLIGHWAEKPSTEQFNIVFNSNGTGIFYVFNTTTSTKSSNTNFIYTFDNNSKILTWNGTDGFDHRTYSVTISGNELILVDILEKGPMTYYYYRQ